MDLDTSHRAADEAAPEPPAAGAEETAPEPSDEPAGEPAAEPPDDEPAAPPEPRGWRARATPRRVGLLVAAVVLVWLGTTANGLAVAPRHDALDAVPDTLRVLGATLLLFGVGGFGIVRLLLPDGLRRFELLWVLPAGGCTVALTMGVIGHVLPYAVSLAVTLALALALAVYAVRRRGWPQRPDWELAWPAYLGLVLIATALIPMILKLHYNTVTGSGSDAHMAAGSALLLQHTGPNGVDVALPIDRMPVLWESKFPIYYVFAGVSTLSGLATWQVLTPLAAALLALAATGLYLVARELLGAGAFVGAAAMGLAGIDRIAIHTGLNPYFNQTWGYVTMPFALVLGWFALQPGTSPAARRGAAGLFVLFMLVLIDAYPLAAPIPLFPLAYFAWSERRRRIAAGEPVPRLRSLHRRKNLWWLVPLYIALLATLSIVESKALGALKVLAPGASLQQWGGDLGHLVPNNFFFSLPQGAVGGLVLLTLYWLTWVGLRHQPRGLARGLGGLFVLGLLLAGYFARRQYGYYFHFKILAYIAPLLIVCAVAGAMKVRRRWGPAFLVVFALLASFSVRDELRLTGLQLGHDTTALSAWARALPPGATVRLDMDSGVQLWAAYFLASRPLCSQHPLLDTDYPHVPTSRKADYIIATHTVGRPRDAIGPPLRSNLGYLLYRENPAVPGVANCSQTMRSRLLPGQKH